MASKLAVDQIGHGTSSRPQLSVGLIPQPATPAAVALFKEDIAYQVEAGFSKVMLWEDVKRIRPKNLKISLAALIPQVGW